MGQDFLTRKNIGLLLAGATVIGVGAFTLKLMSDKSQENIKPVSEDLNPQPGDILLFFHPNQMRDYLIKWVTHSDFYHVGLYAGNGTVLEARPGGVVENALVGREEGFIIVRAPENRGEEALAWAQKQLGTPFDITDILVIGLENIFAGSHIPYKSHGCFTCGWLVTEAYRQAGVDLVPGKDSSHVSPADIAHHVQLWMEPAPIQA